LTECGTVLSLPAGLQCTFNDGNKKVMYEDVVNAGGFNIFKGLLSIAFRNVYKITF